MKMKARIVQGDDVDLVIAIKDKTNTAVDFTGATAITFTAKANVTGDAYITKTLAAGVALSSPATEITVSLTDTDTSEDNLPAGLYYFEVQITDSAGKISTVRDFNDALGELEVLADLDQ